MKRILQLITLLFFCIGISICFNSCSKDDDGGEPRISYVRITDPASADSLLVGAGQGNLIAIVGENLQHTREIWFNLNVYHQYYYPG
jgi:hypothetical protein